MSDYDKMRVGVKILDALYWRFYINIHTNFQKPSNENANSTFKQNAKEKENHLKIANNF